MACKNRTCQSSVVTYVWCASGLTCDSGCTSLSQERGIPVCLVHGLDERTGNRRGASAPGHLGAARCSGRPPASFVLLVHSLDAQRRVQEVLFSLAPRTRQRPSCCWTIYNGCLAADLRLAADGVFSRSFSTHVRDIVIKLRSIIFSALRILKSASSMVAMPAYPSLRRGGSACPSPTSP
jgi:hypothetical protein